MELVINVVFNNYSSIKKLPPHIDAEYVEINKLQVMKMRNPLTIVNHRGLILLHQFILLFTVFHFCVRKSEYRIIDLRIYYDILD